LTCHNEIIKYDFVITKTINLLQKKNNNINKNQWKPKGIFIAVQKVGAVCGKPFK
jgi:hypothetical protein